MNFPSRFVILIIFISSLGFNRANAQTETNKNPSLEEQFKVFTNSGFELNEGLKISDLFNIHDKERYESEPYSSLYYALGSSYPVGEEWIDITNNCFNYNRKSIYKAGSYVYLINQLSRISGGELNFTNVSDRIDSENKKAYVSFTLNQKEYDWELSFYDYNHEVDPSFLDKVDELSKISKTKSKLTYYVDLFGDITLGWLTESELDNLNSATGLNVVWYASR